MNKVNEDSFEEIDSFIQNKIEKQDAKNREMVKTESKHLIVLHLLFELDHYGLNSPLLDEFFNPYSLEMLDDKIEVLTALKNGKKEDEIPKFYDVLEFLNEDKCSEYEEEFYKIDDIKTLDEFSKFDEKIDIEKCFKKAMKDLKKDLKFLKKKNFKKKAKSKKAKSKKAKSKKDNKKDNKKDKNKKDKKKSKKNKK